MIPSLCLLKMKRCADYRAPIEEKCEIAHLKYKHLAPRKVREYWHYSRPIFFHHSSCVDNGEDVLTCEPQTQELLSVKASLTLITTLTLLSTSIYKMKVKNCHNKNISYKVLKQSSNQIKYCLYSLILIFPLIHVKKNNARK